MTALARCPCGEVPKYINVANGSSYRWRMVSGQCCGEWFVEARVTYGGSLDEVYLECVKAWNEANRGELK